MKNAAIKSATVIALIAWGVTAYGGTKASNIGGITNTRHNMTQSFLGASAGIMNVFRNNYGEVCVYCHTPHGANTGVALPLWNRTIKATTYDTYDTLAIRKDDLTQIVKQPGPNSLSCLSCHDGTVAIDSVINMPGSGGYNAAQATTQNDTFLSTWTNADGSKAAMHSGMKSGPMGCVGCHDIAPDSVGLPNWGVAYIGTDLTNDHPIGIHFANSGPNMAEFNQPNKTVGTLSFFDTDGNGRADPNNIRMYDSGSGPSVECASCHDPHGVPSAGTGTINYPTFLRISNTGSALCLTCHIK